jgi:hypothetical protein
LRWVPARPLSDIYEWRFFPDENAAVLRGGFRPILLKK